MSSEYTNQDAKQDQAYDDFLDQLIASQRAVMKEYYANYSLHYKPESSKDWKVFIKLIKQLENGAFEENIANDIDYDFEALLESLSKDTGGMLGVLADLEKTMEGLASEYFDELCAGIDGQLEALNDA